MTDKQFIESMSDSDSLADHDIEVCGTCFQLRTGAEVAREILATGDFDNAVHRWADENQKRWQESKYVVLWQEEVAAGRDPKLAFRARGWEV